MGQFTTQRIATLEQAADQLSFSLPELSHTVIEQHGIPLQQALRDAVEALRQEAHATQAAERGPSGDDSGDASESTTTDDTGRSQQQQTADDLRLRGDLGGNES